MSQTLLAILVTAGGAVLAAGIIAGVRLVNKAIFSIRDNTTAIRELAEAQGKLSTTQAEHMAEVAVYRAGVVTRFERAEGRIERLEGITGRRRW